MFNATPGTDTIDGGPEGPGGADTTMPGTGCGPPGVMGIVSACAASWDHRRRGLRALPPRWAGLRRRLASQLRRRAD